MPKVKPKKKTWTIVFLNREGMPIPFERLGEVVDHFVDVSYERQLLQELQDAMRNVGGEHGAPSKAYAVGVWEGDIAKGRFTLATLEKHRPKFYVYEGGSTTVVT